MKVGNMVETPAGNQPWIYAMRVSLNIDLRAFPKQPIWQGRPVIPHCREKNDPRLSTHCSQHSSFQNAFSAQPQDFSWMWLKENQITHHCWFAFYSWLCIPWYHSVSSYLFTPLVFRKVDHFAVNGQDRATLTLLTLWIIWLRFLSTIDLKLMFNILSYSSRQHEYIDQSNSTWKL